MELLHLSIYIYIYNLNYGWHAFEIWILDDTRSRGGRGVFDEMDGGQEAFFSSFLFTKVVGKLSVTLRSISSSDSMSRAELLFSVRTG